MSRPFPDDPFLNGNYAPWPLEGEARDLVVEGEVPRSLNGAYYRNGPNPQFAPRGRYHWFDGDGMIHGFFFENGRVDYRNRWVRTERFEKEREAGEALYRSLREQGIDVVIDDRDARAGVKFSDVELIGIPWRITVGPKGVAAGLAELTDRSTGETIEVTIDEVAAMVVDHVTSARIPEGAEPIYR